MMASPVRRTKLTLFALSNVFCNLHAGGCGDPGTRFGITRIISGTAVGDRVTYTCQTGYILSGSSSRTCQTSGYWSGRLPTCTSEYFMSFVYSVLLMVMTEFYNLWKLKKTNYFKYN